MVVCKICGYNAPKTIQAHLNHSHKLKNDEYVKMFPGVEIYSEEYLKEFSVKIRKFTSDPDYRKKLSESTKNLWKDPVYRDKMTEEQRRVQSRADVKENHKKGAIRHFENRTPDQEKAHNEALKAAWKNEKVRENRITILKEAHNKSDVKVRHSEATKKYYNNLTEEQKEKKKKVLRDVWASPEMREKLLKLSAIGLEAAMSPLGRANRKLSNLKPEVREKRRRASARNMANMPVVSSLNIRFKEELEKARLKFKMEYLIDYYLVDFCFPENKVVVEVDGDYWHGNPSLYNSFNKNQRRVIGKDKAEKTYLENRGWKLIRFWETAINKDIGSCVSLVQEAING